MTGFRRSSSRLVVVPTVETASPEDYGRYVRAKLEEELEEYLWR